MGNTLNNKKFVVIACEGSSAVDIKDLRDFQGKLKILTPENYNKLRSEILKLGFSEPISVWKNKGKNFILNGHQRLATLTKMRESEGYEVPKIPVSFIYADNKKQAKEKVLALTSQYGEITSEGLKDFCFDSEIDFKGLNDRFRFPEIDFDKLGLDEEERKKGLTDEDEVPEQAPPVCKLGQLWKLGEHRLLCGDCTDSEQVERLMSGEKADITFTSPPYNIGTNAKLRGANASGPETLYNSANDHRTASEYFKFLKGFSDVALSNSGDLFLNVQMLAGSKIPLCELLNAYKAKFKDVLIWDKGFGQPAMAANVYNSAFEFVFVFSDTNSKRAMRVSKEFRGNLQNIFTLEKWRGKEDCQKEHGAIFPVGLPQKFIETHASSSVYDPFLGTGTTLIAAEKTGRKCYGMEIDPHYCDVIIKRWEDFTGNKAVELQDGWDFL